MIDDLTLEYALQWLKTPYIWGGQSPGGIDCSGLVIEILISAGVLPHGYDNTAAGLYEDHKLDWPTLVHSQPGGLVFYGRFGITHVGLLIDHYRIIEAGGGGSKIRSVSEAWDARAFVRIRPWNYRTDFVRMVMPPYPLSPNEPTSI